MLNSDHKKSKQRILEKRTEYLPQGEDWQRNGE